MSWLIPGVVRHAFAFEPVILTPYTFTTIFIPAFLSYYGMAVLAQLPGTRFHRVVLLPVVFWLAARAGMSLDASSGNSGLAFINQGVSLAMYTVAMRSATWVFTQKPYARYPLHKPSEETTNGQNNDTSIVSLRTATWNAWDLTVNLRGIGWNWSHRTHVPKPYLQVTSRRIFFLHTLCRFLFFAIAFDVIAELIRSFGPSTFATPNGGTIFDHSLPPLQRYFRSSLICALAVISAHMIIETVYHLHALLFILLFQQHPAQWPPLFDFPWISTSLAEFWGRRWHQLFREYFVGVGGKALVRYLGRPGLVLGAFTISGFLHDVGMRGMGSPGDTFSIVGFFVMLAIGIFLEAAWKKAMGRRVGGGWGWVWVWMWMLVWGSAMIDAWARGGLFGSSFFPERYRPVKVVLGWLGWDLLRGGRLI